MTRDELITKYTILIIKLTNRIISGTIENEEYKNDLITLLMNYERELIKCLN